MKQYLVLIGLFLVCVMRSLQAQPAGKFPLSVLVAEDTVINRSLTLQLNGQAFFFDAEFFYPQEPGYTLPGIQLQPVLRYRVSKDLDFSAGVHLLKYSGMEQLDQWRPVLSVTYRINPVFSLTMGSLQGSLHHRLPEPLYKYDFSFSDYLEEGIQARINTSFIKGDYWIDWRNFIKWGDPVQEELAFGTSTVFSPFHDFGAWNISIPVYSLVFHRGGQIDRSSLPVRTFGNLAGGILAEKETGNSFLSYYRAGLLFFHYFDVSGNPLFSFTTGTAIYPQMEAGFGQWFVKAGYWWTDHFFSLTGESQFATVSENPVSGNYSNRQLIKMRIGYYHSLAEGPSLYLFTNGYWDLNRSAFDYSLGLQLIFNRTFGLLDL